MDSNSENSLPNSDFDSFLSDLNKEPVAKFDMQQLAQDLDTRFDSVIEELEYQSLNEENGRSTSLWHELLEVTAELHPDMDYEMVEALAKNTFKEMAMNEAATLVLIKMTLFSAEYDIANGTLDPEKITDQKAKLYTDLLIKRGLDSQDPLLSVLNKSIPGPELDPEDPALAPYFMQSMEEFANGEEKNKLDRELIQEACVFLGIDLNNNTDENAAKILSIGHVIFIGRMHFDVQNAAANREERIRTAAREYSLDETTTQGIVRFIELKYPLN